MDLFGKKNGTSGNVLISTSKNDVPVKEELTGLCIGGSGAPVGKMVVDLYGAGILPVKRLRILSIDRDEESGQHAELEKLVEGANLIIRGSRDTTGLAEIEFSKVSLGTIVYGEADAGALTIREQLENRYADDHDTLVYLESAFPEELLDMTTSGGGYGNMAVGTMNALLAIEELFARDTEFVTLLDDLISRNAQSNGSYPVLILASLVGATGVNMILPLLNAFCRRMEENNLPNVVPVHVALMGNAAAFPVPLNEEIGARPSEFDDRTNDNLAYFYRNGISRMADSLIYVNHFSPATQIVAEEFSLQGDQKIHANIEMFALACAAIPDIANGKTGSHSLCECRMKGSGTIVWENLMGQSDIGRMNNLLQACAAIKAHSLVLTQNDSQIDCLPYISHLFAGRNRTEAQELKREQIRDAKKIAEFAEIVLRDFRDISLSGTDWSAPQVVRVTDEAALVNVNEADLLLEMNGTEESYVTYKPAKLCSFTVNNRSTSNSRSRLTVSRLADTAALNASDSAADFYGSFLEQFMKE